MWNPIQSAHELSQHSACGPLRQMAESLVLLAVAVVIFRGFAAEGYMISTGSMAPTLLGYHRRVICPECNFSFAHGASIDEDEKPRTLAKSELDFPTTNQAVSRCPNCGYHGILAESLPRTEGDQLLVHKHAYEFRDPKRWEIIVFRNPGDPRQAYVKRVIGLPGEQMELNGGEVFINGKLARKPYSVQRGMRIPISDYASQTAAGDPDRQPCWVKLQPKSPWTLGPESLSFSGKDQPLNSPLTWIGYRHWIPAGGSHISRVTLDRWPEKLSLPDQSSNFLQYEKGQLTAIGVLSDVDRRTWLSRTDDAKFHDAINTLSERSHVAPILDEYGYNLSDGNVGNPVREFFASLTLANVSGAGRFEMELSDGEHIFTAIFRFSDRVFELLKDGDPVPIRKGTLPEKFAPQPVQIEFSLIDQQVILAADGKELIDPYSYLRTDSRQVVMRRPFRCGAVGLDLEMNHVMLYRDLFYTNGPTPERRNYHMHDGEFFVLGDNSPVSVDSRFWPNPAVPRNALIGKPLVVHLPSRSSRMSWGGKLHDVRLPDFSRVRLVR